MEKFSWQKWLLHTFFFWEICLAKNKYSPPQGYSVCELLPRHVPGGDDGKSDDDGDDRNDDDYNENNDEFNYDADDDDDVVDL